MNPRWKAGDGARVVDLSGLSLPKGKPPFAEGDLVLVVKVSDDGKRLVVAPADEAKRKLGLSHTGWFKAARFAPF